MKIGVSVIIPTRGRFTLQHCIDSIMKQTEYPDEIVVVDNSDGPLVKQLFNKRINNSPIPLKYIREPKKGASYSRNTGARLARYPLLCFIDDDCIADKFWVKEAVTLYSRVGPRAIIKGRSENGYPDNVTSCVQHVGDEMFFRMGYLTDGNHIQSQWLDTKNVLIPKSFFTKEKLKFNKYRIFEDLDFSIQAVKANIPIYYCHNAVVYHKGRSDLIQFIYRQIRKAKDYRSLKKRAQTPTKALRLSNLEQLRFARFMQWKSEKEVWNELIRPILQNKKLFFKIRFHVIKLISDSLVRFVYWLGKI